jgi:choline dehydrogenase-like flavoprotein
MFGSSSAVSILSSRPTGACEAHGVGGPLATVDGRSPNRLSFVFVEACAAAGLPLNSDFNAGHQEGFGLYQVTQRNGSRCSAAAGYLPAAMARVNFTLVTDAAVECFDGVRCTGAIYRRGGKVETIAALSMMRVSLVFLKLRPTTSAPPAMRMATCVHDPSGFFLKASQGKSARPAGYEVIV